MSGRVLPRRAAGSSPQAVNVVSLVEQIGQRVIAARQQAQTQARVPPRPTVELPRWPDDVRGLPNEALRCALFNARNRKQPRRYFRNELIGTTEALTEIRYTGEELRQTDQTYLLQVLHFARGLPLGSSVEFTPYKGANAGGDQGTGMRKGHGSRQAYG